MTSVGFAHGDPDAYLLCGTPRTGSTLLCSLLSSTGVLGHPESYFREPDEAVWARRFGLETDGSRVHDYNAFVQAGFWQHGDVASGRPHQNLDQMKRLHRTIRDHNTAWRSWFGRHGIQPHTATYEGLVDDPRGTVAGVAAKLGVALPAGWQPASRHHKQADDTSAAWAAALRAALEN